MCNPEVWKVIGEYVILPLCVVASLIVIFWRSK
jgi:hypothetical protein